MALIWMLSSCLQIFFELLGAELDTILQVWPEMHQAGWDDQVSASNAPLGATQDLLCAPCCSGALLSPVQPDVHPDPQALFHKAVSLPHRSEPALGSRYVISAAAPDTCLDDDFCSIYMFYLPSLVPLLYSSKTERPLQFCICV